MTATAQSVIAESVRVPMRDGVEISANIYRPASGEPVPAQKLRRMLAPLAAYRSWLGARYDLRILSFDVRLAFWDRRSGGHCSIGGEIGDPEGKRLGPCFRCLDPREGGRVEVCRDSETWPAMLTGKKHVIRQVESALRSNPI